jgi:RHS repeat-associated protein
MNLTPCQVDNHHYYRARYYDPVLGRFLSNDLIAARLDEPLEQNSYLYVRNNPVRFVDPFGLDIFPPEWLANQTIETLWGLYNNGDKIGLTDIYTALRSKGQGTPELDLIHYEVPQRQPDGSVRWGWKAGSPPALEGAPRPWAQPQPQIVGKPGQVGPANPNPAATDAIPAPRGNPTGAVNGGSVNRAGANTNAVRPQPGPPGANTQQVGEAPERGNTLRGSPSAPAAGNSPWTLNPKTIRPGITNAGTVAGLISTAADCYRTGFSNCGPKIVQGIVIGGIVGAVIGKAAGPIGTLIAGGKAWWEIDKELNKGKADQQQRDAEAKAREAQAKENLKNSKDFYGRIEKLRGAINELKNPHDTIVANLPKAQDRASIAATAALVAQTKLNDLRKIKQNKEGSIKEICWLISQTQPATIKQQLDALAAQAERTQRESDILLNQARQLAAKCASAADAQAIREQIRRRAALLNQLAQFKRTGDTQNAEMVNLRNRVASMKGQLQANVTVDVADQALKADNASKEATGFMMQIRSSIEKLEAGKKLHREINALQAAAPEALLANLQDRFNELHALLSALTEYAPPINYDERAQASANRAAADRDEALRVLESWKNNFPCDTEIPSAEAAIQRINTALTMGGLDDTASLLRQAQACEASGKCIPLINQARQLIERLQIEEGVAAIEQARQQGCNVTGLENTLDYYRSIRDAAALLFNAKEQCKFQDGLALAQKMPQSIQNNPWIANGIEELRAGLVAQQQVEQLLARAASNANQGSAIAQKNNYEESRRLFAQADSYLAMADQLARPYPCLVERVNKSKDEYNRIKQAVNNESSDKPTDEVPGVLGNGKSTKPSQPKDPNKPGKAERVGGIIGAVLGGIARQGTNQGGGTGGTTGGGNTGGGTNTGDGNASQRPCTAGERAAFAKMTGAWQSVILTVTISGSCEKATGKMTWAEYCSSVSDPKNTNRKYSGNFTSGHMQGGTLSIGFFLGGQGVHKDQNGRASCSLKSDGTLSCSGFGCGGDLKR